MTDNYSSFEAVACRTSKGRDLIVLRTKNDLPPPSLGLVTNIEAPLRSFGAANIAAEHTAPRAPPCLKNNSKRQGSSSLVSRLLTLEHARGANNRERREVLLIQNGERVWRYRKRSFFNDNFDFRKVSYGN